jgi:ferredoxin
MTMKVRINEERCQGHIMCVMACPEVFGIRDEDGHGYVLEEQVPAGLEEKVRGAARSCPEKAVIVEE